MPQINDPTQLGGLLKDAWGSSVLDVFKFLTPVVTDAPLEEPASSVGGVFHQPVLLQYENGITHAAPGSTPGYGTTPYILPNAGATPDAEVQGSQIYSRSLVTYEAMMRTLNSINATGDDLKKAVRGATRTVMWSAGRSLAKRAEVLAIHGSQPTGLGVIESISAQAASGAQSTPATINAVAGFFIDVSIDPSEWSQGIWAMSEGATYDVYTLPAAAATTSGTVQNTSPNTAITATGQNGLILYQVNPAVSLTGGSLAGAVTGRVLRFFHTNTAATGIASVAIGRALFYESGGPATTTAGGVISIGREMMGIDMLANVNQTVCYTGFGNYGATLYALDSAVYSMWAGNRVSGVGNIKLAQLMEYISTIVNYGVMGMKVRALVPTRLFQQFANDEASLRRYSKEGPKAKNGFSAIEYDVAGGNVLEVIGHPFQKDGKINIYVPDEFHRVGSQEISFLKRNSQGEYVLEVANGAASEMRAMGMFNFYADTNRHLMSLAGVTY